jgi:CubicO group peptidase (beta-lactamase class C family)
VPGVSIAVVDGGKLAWARGYGVTRAGSNDPVTPSTLFPAASISKAVTATATLRLVEQGRLALDEDVNVYLRSWKVPDSEYTTSEKVTLRHLLSHTAGTGVHMFPCYREGEPLPTLVEELDGIPPAKTAPVRVEAVPGTTWRYSGGGVLVEQLVLTDVTGEPFPALLRDLVLAPLGMDDSTFEQPVPSPLRARLAVEHDFAGGRRARLVRRLSRDGGERPHEHPE